MLPKPDWRNSGNEPDYRFSLANERTFLAWIRTALALVAGAVLLEQFATKLHPRVAIVALAVGLSAVSCLFCVAAYHRWKHNEIAMRHAQALPHSAAVFWLTVSITIVSAVIAALLVIQ